MERVKFGQCLLGNLYLKIDLIRKALNLIAQLLAHCQVVGFMSNKTGQKLKS